MRGTSDNDSLTGWNLNGLDGDDWLYGQERDSRILGGDGFDNVNGASGNDLLRGGADDDGIYGNYGNDRLNGDQGNDYVDGGVGNDVVIGGKGEDTILGGDGNDILYGGDGADWLDAGPGRDAVYAGRGDDTLVVNYGCGVGEAGSDTILSKLAGGTYVVQIGGDGPDTHIVINAADGLLGIADISFGTDDTLHIYDSGLAPAQLFTALDTNGDRTLDGTDAASAYGRVDADAASATMWFSVGDDVTVLHGVASVADWQMA